MKWYTSLCLLLTLRYVNVKSERVIEFSECRDVDQFSIIFDNEQEELVIQSESEPLCQSFGGGKLASITSIDEDTFVDDFIDEVRKRNIGLSGNRVWIGLIDNQNSNLESPLRFEFTDSSERNTNRDFFKETGVEPWANEQPNNNIEAADQFCVAIRFRNNNLIGWRDENCDERFSVLCKRTCPNLILPEGESGPKTFEIKNLLISGIILFFILTLLGIGLTYHQNKLLKHEEQRYLFK